MAIQHSSIFKKSSDADVRQLWYDSEDWGSLKATVAITVVILFNWLYLYLYFNVTIFLDKAKCAVDVFAMLIEAVMISLWVCAMNPRTTIQASWMAFATIPLLNIVPLLQWTFRWAAVLYLSVFISYLSRFLLWSFFSVNVRFSCRVLLYFLHDCSSGRCSVHVLAAMFVSQERTVLQDILQREVSVIWMMPAPTLLSIIIELCLYLKEQYIVPYLYRPLKIPFILLHYCLKHKVHWTVYIREVRSMGEALWFNWTNY